MSGVHATAVANTDSAKRGGAPVLSICIPSYNRREQVTRLTASLLAQPGDFEICIHVDGSSDGTLEALQAMPATRISTGTDRNQGRASALLAACRMARGRYIMVFDDDDTLYPDGLQAVLKDCELALDNGTVGFIYHLEDQDGRRIGTEFPVARANFMALRADHGVRGDKKEVVLATAFHRAMFDGGVRYRRTPTSLVWPRMTSVADVSGVPRRQRFTIIA